ncbi:hypothetical protein [Pantoea anthophila]|uniref:hypothetical protein n=1 Tax=Pantoea anthophila TaxID=470931 RepID=UPI00301D3790
MKKVEELKMSELNYGVNVENLLYDLSQHESSDIGEFDVYGEDEQGREGCASIDITLLASDALKVIANLKAQRDALAAENSALKHEVAGEMLRAANDIAYSVFNLADMKVTDLKPGVIESTGPAETALIAERNLRDFAAQLLAGKDGE